MHMDTSSYLNMQILRSTFCCCSLMMAIFPAESGSFCSQANNMSSHNFILSCHWLLVDDGHLPHEVRILLFPGKQHVIIQLHTVMALASFPHQQNPEVCQNVGFVGHTLETGKPCQNGHRTHNSQHRKHLQCNVTLTPADRRR